MSTFGRLADVARATAVLGRTGVLHPEPPSRVLRMAGAIRHWGQSLATVFAISAARYDTRVAIVDERGPITFAELEHRTAALARGLMANGVGAGDTVGVLCRNHRYFFDVTGALAKLGVNVLFLNTGFSAPQLEDVMNREHARVLVHDEEFSSPAASTGAATRLLAWVDASSGIDRLPASVDDLIMQYCGGRAGRRGRSPRPGRSFSRRAPRVRRRARGKGTRPTRAPDSACSSACRTARARPR